MTTIFCELAKALDKQLRDPIIDLKTGCDNIVELGTRVVNLANDINTNSAALRNLIDQYATNYPDDVAVQHIKAMKDRYLLDGIEQRNRAIAIRDAIVVAEQ